MSRSINASCFHGVGVMVAGALLFSSVLAEDGMTGEFSFKLQSDSVISADSEESEETTTFVTIEPALSVPIASGVALNAGFIMEEVEFESDEGDVSEDYDVSVTELLVEWSNDRLSAHAGKISPGFGIAWGVGYPPGLYHADFAGDYEIAGQLGAGIVISFGEDEESVVLTFDLFREDTTALSSCLMDDRCARARLEDGGPANTSGFRSFSTTVGSDSLSVLGGLGFHAGILRRAGGDGDSEDELGFALALTSAVEFGSGASVEWILEGARLDNFEAGSDDVTYATAGATYLNGPWNVALAASFKNTDSEMEESTDDNLFQISAGYAFESGFSIDVAWRRGDEGDESSQTIGALIAYGAEF